MQQRISCSRNVMIWDSMNHRRRLRLRTSVDLNNRNLSDESLFRCFGAEKWQVTSGQVVVEYKKNGKNELYPSCNNDSYDYCILALLVLHGILLVIPCHSQTWHPHVAFHHLEVTSRCHGPVWPRAGAEKSHLGILEIRPFHGLLVPKPSKTATYNLLWNQQQEWVTLPTLGIGFNIYYHS